MPPLIEPLESHHNRAAFRCAVEPLDRYLKQQATQDLRSKVAAVFVLRQPESSDILGYYTLSATVIALESLEPALQKRLPRYPALPALLLGRLAVDQRQQGRGYGKLLLVDALKRSLHVQTQLGAVAITVDAKDENARAFYEHYGFRRFLRHQYRLYLPLRTIEQLFPEQPA